MHSDMHGFCELGAHENPLGTQGEHANSTQKGPFAVSTQGMGTDDMEEQTHPRQHGSRLETHWLYHSRAVIASDSGTAAHRGPTHNRHLN